jgi:serine/threonine-protein kinase
MGESGASGGRTAADAPASTFKIGDTIDGKYVLRRVLGEGGMGVVFEAEHIRLKQRCAIKVLNAAMLELPDIVKRFEREARASAQLRGPHVVRVTDVETTSDGVPYIVMEYLEGRDLETELQSRARLSPGEAVDYVLQACGAVAEAHAAGIVHRDLKPGNLYLAREGDAVVVKVLDFGISKLADEDAGKLTGSGTMIGTALYMSPEQLRSAATVDGRADIWALGVILYELVSGATPFNGSPAVIAVQIVSDDAPRLGDVPPALAAVVEKMLARDAERRYATVADLAAALAPFAPPGSVGEAVAAQIVRRSQRGTTAPLSDPALRATDVNAPTLARPDVVIARDVTNVGVTTSAGIPKPLSRRTMGAIVVGIVGVIGVIAVGIVYAGRKPPPAIGAPTSEPSTVPPPAVAIASVAATATPISSATPADPRPAPAPTTTTTTPTATAPRGSAPAPARPATSASAKPRPRPPGSAENPLFLN